MNKFNLTSFLVENKLTRLGRLSEMYGDSDGDRELDKSSEAKAEEHYQAGLEAYNAGDLQTAEQHYQEALRAGDWIGWGEAELPPYGSKLGESEEIYETSEGYMGTDYESSEDMAVDMVKKGMYEEESEVEEDYSKYGSVEELMKEIETSTNEAAMKHKMDRVKKAYESLEAKATSLEEGEHASYIAPMKIKEMKRSAKKLRMMHEKLMKDYDKKYASKKKVELNEEMGETSLVKNIQDLTWEDVSSAFVGIGDVQPGGFRVKKGVNFPLPKDESTVVYTSSDFDAWKAKTMQMFGDVEVELNPMAKASFDQVKINNPDFQSKKSAYIDSKARFISRDAEMGREID
jgi:tetratricopeptide (TPR) repeat protein